MSAGAEFPRRHVRYLLALLGLTSVIAGCSSKEAAGPPAVAAVSVSPSRPSLDVGDTLRLRATVEDDAGNVVTDRDVLWSTDRPDIAMVSQRGDVIGVSAGTATISATAGGARGSARVTVVARKVSVFIAATAPDPLVEGQSATITGQGFDSVAANNRVTVDGVVATVTEATRTRLTITVPAAECRPARNVQLHVTTAEDQQGQVVSRSLRPTTVTTVPVGNQLIMRNPASFCLQFAPSQQAEAYLVGIQSVEESPKSLTSVKVDAVSATAGGVAPSLAPELARAPRPFSWQQDAQGDTLMLRHLAAEAKARAGDREAFERHRAQPAAMRVAPSAAMPATFPSTLKVGDVVSTRVPAVGRDVCAAFTSIQAVVRHIGTKGVWLEDVANPAGGYALSDIQLFSQLFDSQIYPGDVEYFGAPTDVDGNGRVAVVITKEVNKMLLGEGTFLLGFVAAADLVSRNTCASSNEGEVFYGRVPDATGSLGYPLSRADMLSKGPRNLAHELVHIIQFSQRLYGGGQIVFPSYWEQEGQATLAEEVIGHRVMGNATGRNYGRDVVEPPSGVLQWYWATFDIVGLYYGWRPQNPRMPNAPEQCSWLERTSAGNTGPCFLIDLLPYGMGWLFLRWLSDQFGPMFPGGEKGLHKALIALRQAGLGAVAGLVGVPADSLLAQFAAMQYVDDRVPNAAPRLTLPSWNLTQTFSPRESQVLIPRERTFSTFSDAVSVRGVSTAYYRISGTGRAGTALRVRAPDGNPLPAHMRLWVVRLQ